MTKDADPRSSSSLPPFKRDAQGRIVTDHYGRPVRERSSSPRSTHSDPASKTPTGRTPASPQAPQFIPASPHRKTRKDRSSQRAKNRRSVKGNKSNKGTATPKPPTYVRSSSSDSSRYGTPLQPKSNRVQSNHARTQNPDTQFQPLAGSSAPSSLNSGQQSAPHLSSQPPYSPQPSHHRPPHTPKKGRPRKKRRTFLRILTAFLLCIILLLGITAWRVDSNLQRIDALNDYPGRLKSTSGTNWLLVGTDSRAGLTAEDGERLSAGNLEEGGARTDSIILVHIPRFGGKATMLSFPRDSEVDIPGYGTNKLNASYAFGGPALLQQTIEEETQIHIDHYMEIGFGGFANVVDSLGGIEICSPEAIDDPMAGLNIPAGCQTMDGPTALGYVRTRYTSANGDLDRVERQRQFLSAMVKKLGSAGTILNPFRAFPTINALSSNVAVDKEDHVWNLAKLALALGRGSEQKTVPIGGYGDGSAGSTVIWDEDAAEELFQSLR